MKPGDTAHIVRTTRRRAYYEGTAVITVVRHKWKAEGGLCFECMVRFEDGCEEVHQVYESRQANPKQWISRFNSGESRVPSQAA